MKSISLAAVAKTIEPIVRTVTNNPRADVRKLRPRQLLQLLNSTALGSVLTDQRLRKHRNEAATRIGDGKTVDLLRYAGWLAARRERSPAAIPDGAGPKSSPGKDAYERKKVAEAERNRRKNAAGKEIGSIPPVANPKRRQRALGSLKQFMLTYGDKETFECPFSPAHETAIERFEDIVNNGGQGALAMPRGSGKTVIAIWAVIYAACLGKRKFIVFIAAIADEASKQMEDFKTILESNDLLAEDFPEICFPIRALEGTPQRGRGQTCEGHRTRIGWGGKRMLILPTVKGSQSSGIVLAFRGILSAMRGMKHVTADGRVVRPDLAVIDDPQTDASAVNPAQVQKRLKAINSTVLRLAKRSRKIAAFLLCTVVAKDDLAEQVLDRKRNPQWRGQLTRALDALPTNDEAWSRYAEAWAEGMQAEDNGKKANAHYRKNRKALEEGAIVVWPEMIEEGDVSALQSIMNVKIADEATFWAELQQQPIGDDNASDDQLTVGMLEVRVIQTIERGIVTREAPRLTAFIDPNSKVLWWMVCGFGQGFTGHIVEIGTWPDQKLNYFTTRSARHTLAKAKKGAGKQAQLLHGLESLTDHLLDREWEVENQSISKIEGFLVDANMGQITDTVYRFTRQSKFSGVLTPSHGKGLGPSDKKISQWSKQPGDRVGNNWRERYAKEHGKRFVLFDTNRWKSHVVDRLKTAVGDAGALTFYNASAVRHRLLFDHLLSESPEEKVDNKGNRLTIWKQDRKKDNDLWDGVVGCHVAASMIGIDLDVEAGGKPKAKKRKSRRKRVSDLAI